MNAELTAENRPACVLPGSVSSMKYGNRTTYEDKGCVQILVVLPCIISVELFRFPSIDSEEVGPRVLSSEWIEELLKGRMEAGC